MAGVFISYRREDSPGHAGRVFDALRARLGPDLVFMDVQGIDAGVDFVKALERAVGSCDALLAVIGPGWLSSEAGSLGLNRLNDAHDFVRFEIRVALERDVRVVPVLVDNAKLPEVDELPDDLKALTRRNAVELRDSRWDVDVNDLAGSLETLMMGSAGAKGVPALRGGAVPRSRRRYVPFVAAVIVLIAAASIFGFRGCVGESPDATATVTTASDAGLFASSPSLEELPDTRAVPARGGGGARGSSHKGLGIGWFGLWLADVTDTPPGVIVGEVITGGPAADAGIMENDVLVEVAGESVNTYSAVADAVVHHVKSTPAGTPGIVNVVRNGVPHQFMVFFDREFVLSR